MQKLFNFIVYSLAVIGLLALLNIEIIYLEEDEDLDNELFK